jgi:hypothetical protein
MLAVKKNCKKEYKVLLRNLKTRPRQKRRLTLHEEDFEKYENKNSSAYKTAEYEFQQKTGKTSSSAAKEFESFLLNKQKEESAQIFMGKGIKNDVKLDASGNVVTDSSGAAVKEENTWRNKKTGELVTERRQKTLANSEKKLKVQP